MRAIELIDALGKKLATTSQGELAAVLGVSVATLTNWKNRDEDLTAQQVAAALAKSRAAAVRKAQLETIKPIAEFYAIDYCGSGQGVNWEVLDGGKTGTRYAQGLKKALKQSFGIYIFYDSRGRALYVGKACKQSLWKEMNLALNRKRNVQSVKLVRHPERNQEFKPGYEKLRQPTDTQLKLYDLAHYFTAYSVDNGMIDDLESLMVRGFANDLLNVRMETFAHSRDG